MTTDSSPTVLIVEDERTLADLYATWLADTYAVRTAYSGETALERMDTAVDVVLLDRRMPGLSGADVLEGIREHGYGCRVAMVTAVEPGPGIVGMGFDDYLIKPTTEDELHATVDRLVTLATYDDHLGEYYAVASKKAILDARYSTAELDDNDQYTALEARLAELEAQLDASFAELDRDGGDEQHRFLTALLCRPGGHGDTTTDAVAE